MPTYTPPAGNNADFALETYSTAAGNNADFNLSDPINVTPSPVVVNARVVAPTVTLNATPSPVVVNARVVAPTVTLNATPSPVVVNARVVAPTVTLNVTPSPVVVQARVVAPTVTVGGDIFVTPSPIRVIARVVAPIVTLSGGGVDGGYSSGRALRPGQLYGREPEWMRQLRERRRILQEAATNPDDPAVVRARLEEQWSENEREREEEAWLLGVTDPVL